MPTAATAKMDSSTLASSTTPARNARPSARDVLLVEGPVARRTAWTARVRCLVSRPSQASTSLGSNPSKPAATTPPRPSPASRPLGQHANHRDQTTGSDCVARPQARHDVEGPCGQRCDRNPAQHTLRVERPTQLPSINRSPAMLSDKELPRWQAPRITQNTKITPHGAIAHRGRRNPSGAHLGIRTG
jgi:hypothetical protein